MQLKCENCGKPFSGKPAKNRKYCSRECYQAVEGPRRAAATEKVAFTCAACGTPFTMAASHLRAYRKSWGKDPLYCSRACAWLKKRKTEGQSCIVCGGPVPIQWRDSDNFKRRRTVGLRNTICSSECRKAFKVAELARLKPLDSRGITKRVESRTGYIRVHIPRTAEREGRDILEHRYVMEQMLGRPLTSEETVHHINGQRTDNRQSNLSLRSGRHGPGGDVPGMIRWAHEFIARYPQFDAEGNFHPVNVETG